MRNVYLVSFRRSHDLPQGVLACSAAVYPPRGYEHYPKVDWVDIRRQGRWIRPRDFIHEQNPLDAYRLALLSLYHSRLEDAKHWASRLTTDVALCCWCPYDQAAQRQLEQFGSFVCHTAVVGEFIDAHLGLQVWEDADRRRMAVLTQR